MHWYTTTMLFIAFGLILIIIIIVWCIGFFIRTDFSVPDKNISRIRTILAIFPHPDDEVLTIGGLTRKKQTTLLILTRGEAGTHDSTKRRSLGRNRMEELKKSARILGIHKLIHDDLGDGQLAHKKSILTKRIRDVITQEKPDMIVTYDLSGLYGHSDHIACSEVVTDMVKDLFPHIQLWYATHPKKILKFASLPEHMATNRTFFVKRTVPTVKTFSGLQTIAQIRAVYAHASQYESFRSAFPFRFIPLWFLLSLSLHEYFYEAN